MISPDEILEIQEGLSLFTFNKTLKTSPKLERGSSPTTQIGFLKAQSSANRGNQTRGGTPTDPSPSALPNTTKIGHITNLMTYTAIDSGQCSFLES